MEEVRMDEGLISKREKLQKKYKGMSNYEKMIIWIFMILDLIVLIATGMAHFGYATGGLLFMCAGYLVVKGAIFFDEFMSKVDLVLGVYIFLMAVFGFTSFMDYFIFGWFLYKLLFVLLSDI